MLKNSILLLSVSTLLSPIVALLVEILTHWSFNCPCRSTSLAIKLVLFTLQVTSGTCISTRDPATEWSSLFVRRCVVLLHSLNRLLHHVHYISRFIAWSLFSLKASYLVKCPISTWSFMWWCQFIDLLKFKTRPSFLLNFGQDYCSAGHR